MCLSDNHSFILCVPSRKRTFLVRSSYHIKSSLLSHHAQDLIILFTKILHQLFTLLYVPVTPPQRGLRSPFLVRGLSQGGSQSFNKGHRLSQKYNSNKLSWELVFEVVLFFLILQYLRSFHCCPFKLLGYSFHYNVFGGVSVTGISVRSLSILCEMKGQGV